MEREMRELWVMIQRMAWSARAIQRKVGPDGYGRVNPKELYRRGRDRFWNAPPTMRKMVRELIQRGWISQDEHGVRTQPEGHRVVYGR